ncbi:hypothetical protein [Winogradskyella sp. R77965]|uniref:hypothetical protein n=1 Tax=Winogradskyella sp. R77965 TaxID=3093872 RepID=UPI0037DC4D07
MMNFQHYFNFNRFFKLLKFDISFNTKKYLIFIGVLIIVLFILDLILIDTGSTFRVLENNDREYFYRKRDYQSSLVITFLVTMFLVVSSAFSAFRKKESTSNYLLHPASTFEKLLVQFVIRVLLFSMVFIVVFWADFKLASFTYKLFNFKDTILIPNFALFDVFPHYIKLLDKTAIILGILSFASYLLLNAVHFKKNVMLKTIVLFGIFALSIFLLNVMLSHLFLPNEVKGFDVKVYHRYLENGLRSDQFCTYIIGIFSSLFLLPLTYFKLKEKQV